MEKYINKNIRKIRLITKGLLNSLLFKLLHKQGFNSRNTVVIFGSIRSGSTWLAEILSSPDGHAQIFEPLHPVYVTEVKKYIPEWNQYVPAAQKWPEGKIFFNKIVSGKVINPWTMSQTSLAKIVSAKMLVVKIVRGNLLLEWFANNVTSLKPILVIRHPCAIIASQLNKAWPPARDLILNHAYFKQYPELKEACMNLTQPEELAALAWCHRYHGPLMAKKPYPFVLVCYEDLVRNGQQELNKIFDAWNMPVDQKAVSQLSVPSDTVTSSSQIVSGKDPLSGWKNKLSEQQVSNVFKVLKIFNMGFYSHELEPDHEKLASFGQSKND